MLFSKSLNEVVLGWEDRGNCNQYHHDLTSMLAYPDKDMAKKAKTVVLIKGLDLEGLKKASDCSDNGVRLLIFQKT